MESALRAGARVYTLAGFIGLYILIRYTRMAVPLNSAAFSSCEAEADRRLNVFQRIGYVQLLDPGGKSLSNMQRSTPNASAQVSMKGFHSAANCPEVAGGLAP
jgi:hypothetical protein